MNQISFTQRLRELGLEDVVQKNLISLGNEKDEIVKKDSGGMSFGEMLAGQVKDVNMQQKTADQMVTNIASGRSENLHETMLASTQAELTFNLMVQVRNKALEAYQEIMRMPV